MSRTEKHRPYFVQSRERGTSEHHRHELLGEQKLIRRKKRDARGRVIMLDQPVTLSLWKASTLLAPAESSPAAVLRYKQIRAEAARRLSAGERVWDRIDGPEKSSQPVYENYVVGTYADYCTVDEGQDRDERVAGTADRYAPCSRGMTHVESSGAYGRARGERARGYYRDHRLVSRRSTRNTTRQLSRLADAGDELDTTLDRLVH